jgi:hypothetical protein
MPESNNNWKTKIIIGSTIVGAASGLMAGLLLSRTAEERGDGPPKVKTGDALRLAIGIIGLVRGIAALGNPD